MSVAPAQQSPAQISATNIKSFITDKAPSSNNEFAATVAYFYRFEAAEALRKDSVTSEDLQEACRLAGRERLHDPGKTLRHAHEVGLLNKSGDRGAYSISTVGENLVAVALPSGVKKGRNLKGSRRKNSTSKSPTKAIKSSTRTEKPKKG